MSLIEIQSDISSSYTNDATFPPYIATGGNMLVVGSGYGKARIYRRNEDSWTLVQTITMTNIDYVRSSVSINDNILVISKGNLNVDGVSKAGTIEIYHKDEGGTDNWGQVKIITGTENMQLGYVISLENNTLVAGARGNGQINGKVYIYEKDQDGTNQWGEVATLSPTVENLSDYFSMGVSIYGNYIVVGAPTHDNTGAIYIFKKENGTWTQKHKKTVDVTQSSEMFGTQVSIHGDYIIASAMNYKPTNSQTHNGRIVVFYKDQGSSDNWGQVQIIQMIGEPWHHTTKFGTVMKLLGDYFIVGVPSCSGWTFSDRGWRTSSDVPTKSGCVFVYKKDDNAHTWSAVNEIFEYLPEKDNKFGQSIAINSDYIYVTRNANSSNIENKYKVNTYKLEDSGIEAESKADITTQSASGSSWVGQDVYCDDNHLVVVIMEVKAEIFKKDGENWTSVTTITPTLTNKKWGWRSALSGDYLVIGEWKADNTNGDGDAGIIYIYKKDHGGTDNWGEVHKIEGGANDRLGYQISVDGDYLITKGSSGPVLPYIYKRDNGLETWTEQCQLPSPPQIADVDFKNRFWSVLIKGDYAFVGDFDMVYTSVTTIDTIGGFYIYKKNTGLETWSHLKTIFLPILLGISADEDKLLNYYGMYFGEHMDIHNDNLIVGSRGNIAIIFSKDEGGTDNWGLVSKLETPLAGGRDGFTHTHSNPFNTSQNDVCLHNNLAVYSAPKHWISQYDGQNDYYGKIWIYKKDSNTGKWNNATDIIGPTKEAGIGFSMALRDNILYYKEEDTNKVKRFNIVDAAAAAAAALATANTESETALTTLNVSQAVVTVMIAIRTVLDGGIRKVNISNDVKNSILKTSGGQAESKTNIRKKRKEFLKILFANNASDTKIKMSAADIGLDETLKTALGSASIKENVSVVKKNVATAIDVSTETSSDTGIYADLGEKDDFVKFNIGTGNEITVTKTQDASSNGDVDQWTVNYNGTNYVKEEGEKITLDGKTIYIGSVYIDGESSGIPTSGIFDLGFALIPYDADTNTANRIYSSSNKIRTDRHTAIETIWTDNPSSEAFVTNSVDLGLDRTVGKPIKKTVKVLKARNGGDDTIMSNLTGSDITKNQAVYGAIDDVGDYVVFQGTSTNFRVQVIQKTPKKLYMLKTQDGTGNLSAIQYEDGQWCTHDGVTFYFGGVYTSGTNDGITAADPYVFPIKGNPYKLPDKAANYCLYSDKNTFITGMVRRLPIVEQEKMRKWVIEKVGSDTNNGAELVTDGFFYSAIHVNTSQGEFYLDMETKVCNTNNKGMFKVDFKNSKDNSELFKGEHKTTATISWNNNGNLMAIDVDFFENPQIRNGIRMNTVSSITNPIGLLIEDYEPSLLKVKNPKNKLSKYNSLVEKLNLGNRVVGEKLYLQKEGEMWSRHRI